MDFEPEITIRDVPQSDAIEASINKKIDKLVSIYQKIMRLEIVIEQVQRHKHQGKTYNTRISVSVPGSEFTVNHAVHEDVYVSIRDAFNSIRRKLHDFNWRRRGAVKKHQSSLQGIIVKLFPEEGFGFIAHNGNEYYFSSANVMHPEFDKLSIGTEVQFIESEGDDGLQANRVSVGKHHTP